MPDANGLPTAAEVGSKVRQIAPDVVPQAADTDAAASLAAVVAEFQSPVAYDGSGGTGRTFVPVTETRLFDGQGYPDLAVPDIVPGQLLAVSVSGVPLTDVLLRNGYAGRGWATLVRQGGGGYGYGYGYAYQCGFPRGVQNVSVTATWGAPVTPDICAAIRGEAARRVVIASFVPLSGAGETVKVGDFEIDTAAGISVWAQSSPIALLKDVYRECVTRYRVSDRPQRRAWAAMQRMC